MCIQQIISAYYHDKQAMFKFILKCFIYVPVFVFVLLLLYLSFTTEDQFLHDLFLYSSALVSLVIGIDYCCFKLSGAIGKQIFPACAEHWLMSLRQRQIIAAAPTDVGMTTGNEPTGSAAGSAAQLSQSTNFTIPEIVIEDFSDTNPQETEEAESTSANQPAEKLSQFLQVPDAASPEIMV